MKKSYHPIDINTHEQLYHMANMAEANWLMGIPVTFYPCINHTRDIESDWYPQFSDPVEINILLDSNPKTTLDHMNWLAESEDLPFVAYISNINYPKFSEFKKNCDEKDINKKQAFDNSFKEDGITPTDDNPFYINVDKYSMVVMPYKVKTKGTQKFTVTDLQGDSINPFIWICKLAPYRDQFDLDSSTPEIDTKIDNDLTEDKDGIVDNIYLNFDNKEKK